MDGRIMALIRLTNPSAQSDYSPPFPLPFPHKPTPLLSSLGFHSPHLQNQANLPITSAS